MAKTARKQTPHHSPHAPKKKPLKLVSGGEEQGVGGILSGKVSRRAATPKKTRERKRPTEELPKSIRELGDIYAAGKTVEREMDFKVRYAEQQVKDYCVHRFAELYAASGKRPPSTDYVGVHSRFSFVQTVRTYLTYEKVEALKELNIDIDEHTELKGLRINYEAIRRHGLEKDLRKALESLGVSNDILEECFVPDIQIKPAFYEILDNIAKESLRSGEKLADKIYDVVSVLAPGSQVRNLEAVGLKPQQCFDLVMESEIAAPPEDEEEADIA